STRSRDREKPFMTKKIRYAAGTALVLFGLMVIIVTLRSHPAKGEESTQVHATFAHIPLSFEQNVGQTDEHVRYVARGSGYTIFLTETDAVISLRDRQGVAGLLRLKPAWASGSARLVAGDPQTGLSNYFIGNDPSKWHTNVA